MNKISLGSTCIYASIILSLAGCAQMPFPRLKSGAGAVKIGLNTPPVKQCDYVTSLTSEYKNPLIGKGVSINQLRLGAMNQLKNQAQASQANYVYVKREDTEMSGALKYKVASAVVIYGDAFKCKPTYYDQLRTMS